MESEFRVVVNIILYSPLPSSEPKQTFPYCPALPAACNVLAIPGVSISVKWLFSQCGLSLSSSRSSMTTETTSKEVVTKMLQRTGFGDDMHYLAGNDSALSDCTGALGLDTICYAYTKDKIHYHYTKIY